MKRRLLLLAALGFMTPFSTRGAVPAVVSLAALVKVVGEAGDAISKITKGVRDLVVAGKDSYDYVSAERVRTRLLALSKNLQKLVAGSNAAFLDHLQHYIHSVKAYYEDRQDGDQTVADLRPNWEGVLRQAQANLTIVHAILVDLDATNSDFVLQPAYLGLQEVLYSRTSVLRELQGMPPPVSMDDVRQLDMLRLNYTRLRLRTMELIAALNAYLQQPKGAS